MLYLANRVRQHSPDTHPFLLAADGYLYLGLANEALDELDAIVRAEQSGASVLLARIRVLLHLRRWKDAETLSGRAVSSHPDEDEFTVQRAFALHQMQKGEKAVEVLLAAPE